MILFPAESCSRIITTFERFASSYHRNRDKMREFENSCIGYEKFPLIQIAIGPLYQGLHLVEQMGEQELPVRPESSTTKQLTLLSELTLFPSSESKVIRPAAAQPALALKIP